MLCVHHHVESFNVILYVAHQVVVAVAVSVEPFDALFGAVSTRTYCFHDPCVFICDNVELWGDGFFWKTANTTKVSRARSTHACTEVEHSLARKPIAEADCSNFMDCDFVLAHSSCWLVQLPHEPEFVEQLAISR